MTIRPRTWLSALVITAMGVAGFAAPSAANVPQRDTGTLDCGLDGSGHASVEFDPTLNGTAAFEAAGPGDPKVTAITGDEAEVIDGGNEFTTTGFAKTAVGDGLTIDVDGVPNTACALTFGVDETPSNDEVTSADVLTGVAGSVDGTTRAATLSLPDEPQPMPDANRVVWYRWTAPTTAKMRFEIEPKSGTTSFTDPGTIWTSVCIAMYDPAVNLFTPLIVGGVATADGQAAHGAIFDIDVTAGTRYTLAACSGGGTGQWASTFEYTAAGAFTLSWNRASAPNPQDDLAVTDVDTAKTLDVLHHDPDPDGDPLPVSELA